MSFFNNMKVATRLAWGFGTLLALSGIILGVGLVRMQGMAAGMNLVANDRMPKVQMLEEISVRANDNLRLVRDIILRTEAKDIAAAKAAFDKNVAANLEAFSKLEKTIALPAGVALLKETQAALAILRQNTTKVIELGSANRNDEATALLYGPTIQAEANYEKAMEKLVDFQKNLVRADAQQATASYESGSALMIGVGLVAVVSGVALAIAITRSLTRQLGGEPGDAAELARAVAQGDLSRAITVRRGDTTSLVAQLASMQGSLVQVVQRVRVGSESVSTASAEIAQGNHDLSGRTESQASSLEETAASMEQLGSTVRQNADNAAQANQLATQANTVALKGGEAVTQVVNTMKEISESSRRIADIISVIDGIAFQTNILALNAAVEAARAGEQGRGFAVVASEVRSLAGRSAEAAKEIKTLITASNERVEQGTATADQAGATMTEVVAAIQRVTDIMGEISAASTEQSQGVAQVGEAVTQMDQVTQQNAALVEEMAAAASSLKTQAQDLVQAVSVFRLRADASQPAVAAPLAPMVAVAKPEASATPQGKPKLVSVPRPAKQVGTAVPLPAAPKLAAATTGTDGEWASF